MKFWTIFRKLCTNFETFTEIPNNNIVIAVPVERNGKSLTSETEVLNELPRDITDRTLKLANMLFESAMTFFRTHSLKVSMSDETVSRAINEGNQFFCHNSEKPNYDFNSFELFHNIESFILVNNL